jgi:hypothetical protein
LSLNVAPTISSQPHGQGARVSIDHDFRPRLPGFARFVDRAFTRPIAGRTLATFKALAEALADEGPLPGDVRAGLTDVSRA